MSDITIRQLANMVGTPEDKLLAQLAGAGMQFEGPDQVISNSEKTKLLDFLRRNHGKQESAAVATPKQITLKRRKVSEITVAGGRGASAKTVNVEVRARRTYVKRAAVPTGDVADSEREDALRKLEVSREQHERELAELAEQDRRRKEEQQKLEAAEAERKRIDEERARAEAEAIAVPAAEEPANGDAAQPASAHVRRHEAPKPPVRENKDAAAHKGKRTRGSHRMRDEQDEGAARYTGGELHLTDAERARRSTRKRAKPRVDLSGITGQHGFSKPVAPQMREIPIGETVVVADLAQKMAVKGSEVVKALFKMGTMVTINQAIDHDTAALVVEELGHKPVDAAEKTAETELAAHAATDAAEGEQASRPPVVTIMGHVDHGKTSLLDTIRRTKVASGEAGGITQHIGAYHVETPKGVITFLDTPGHAAFTSMRARGAQSTDIVVLVVAADDGVMPQTVEAINHARAAKVPLIVAVNKMDKPDANPDNVRQGLAQHEVIPEDWGGDTQFVPVSAKTGDGVDKLLEAIGLQAEVMELKAVPDGRASGVVIESSLDKGRGPVATVLVQQGLLKRGDYVVCGVEYGRVRALFDETGKQVEGAGPSIPVQMLGLSGVPEAGDEFVVVADEKLARNVVSEREARRREKRLVTRTNTLEDVMAMMGKGEGQQTLNILIKADVQGSAEALRESLSAISNDLVKVNVITSGVGGITESDATLASASKALVIGFNVRADASARRVIEQNGVDLRYFSLIYDVIDQVKQAASGLMGMEVREEIIGTAEVRNVFRSSKFGAIAGCMVIEGSVKRHKPIRVLRDDVVIFEGELESLRHFKENVDEAKNGTECGIGVKQYNDVKPGDRIECFERIEVARTL
ncbi:MAG TPA: translation initiation factor IF-2 [Rhodanobacteraceae bacterium]|nr:translation initiation factor IF-2 [Rhodanobacteraceae bacterium]